MGMYAGGFLQAGCDGGTFEAAGNRGGDVAGFVGDLPRRYRPRTVELAASALRSFFRFLTVAGLGGGRLEDAVPMVPHRPSGLVRQLEAGRLDQLLGSLDRCSPRGLRDRAIILCVAGWGCGPA